MSGRPSARIVGGGGVPAMGTPGARERAATSAEAALLLGSIFLVALPAFAVLGRHVSGSFDDTCDGISRSQDGACVTTQSATLPAIRPAPPRNPAEAPAAEWASRTRPSEVPELITCDPVPGSPPPGTSSDCDIRFGDGTTVRVVVTWVDPPGEPVVRVVVGG